MATPQAQILHTNTVTNQQIPPTLPYYVVASVPPATTVGQLIYVTNEAGGAVPAFSDGTNWRRVTDRAVIT